MGPASSVASADRSKGARPVRCKIWTSKSSRCDRKMSSRVCASSVNGIIPMVSCMAHPRREPLQPDDPSIRLPACLHLNRNSASLPRRHDDDHPDLVLPRESQYRMFDLSFYIRLPGYARTSRSSFMHHLIRFRPPPSPRLRFQSDDQDLARRNDGHERLCVRRMLFGSQRKRREIPYRR